jgi:hypothetical protein
MSGGLQIARCDASHCPARVTRLTSKAGPSEWRKGGVNLREQVEKLLPGWESWYPSLFDAARDLGIIRARVCPPSSLLLSSRHSGIRQDAQNTHRENWSGSGNVTPIPRRKKQRR